MGDAIHLPWPENFKTMGDYYSTALHEHTHWTGHESRLNRPIVNRFGSEEYAEEELVAELGSAFLCSHLGVPCKLRELEFYQLSSQKQSSSAMLVGCASLTSHHFARLPRQFIWRLALLAT